MKNILVITTLCLLVSLQAMATRARLQALGQPLEGSFYLLDSRNVFKNPAAISALPSHVVVETGRKKPQAVEADGYHSGPEAEAGLFRDFGGMKAGLFLGRQEEKITLGRLNHAEIHAGVDSAPNTYSRFLTQTNPFEIFVGQDMAGMTFAGSIYYSNAGGDAKESSMVLRLGAMSDEFDFYLHQVLTNAAEYSVTSESAKREFKNSGGTTIGGSYNMGNYTLFADYRSSGYKLESTAAIPTQLGGSSGNDVRGKYENSEMRVGFSQQSKFEEKAFVFWTVEYFSNSIKDSPDTGSEVTTTITQLPFTVGMESPLSAWLTVRGSLRQNIFLDESKVEEKSDGDSASDSTVKKAVGGSIVNVGLSLTFDKVSVDGTLSVGNTGYFNFSSDEDGNHFLSNLSVSYLF